MSHAPASHAPAPHLPTGPAPAPAPRAPGAASCRSSLGTYPECPLCGGALFPEHAHFKCSGCGWRDSCCD